MKRIGKGLLLSAAAGLAVASSAQAQFNIVNNIPGTFTDISATGTVLTFANIDDGTAAFTSSVTNALVPNASLYACTNGFISNNAGFTDYTNLTLPYATYNYGLFPFWDDLYDDAPGSVRTQSVVEGGINVQIIQWTQVALYPGGANPRGTFQVKIFGSGTTLAQFIYQDVVFGNSASMNGGSATIGVQTSNSSANQYSYNIGSVGNGVVLSVVADTTTGACCNTNGSCTANVTQANCQAGGGVWQGANSVCGTCPQPGACCKFDGSCIPNILAAACTAQGGTFQGNGSACGTCPPVPPVFYTKCNISTGPTTLAGNAAPAGGVWSEVARDEVDPTSANTVAGFTATGGYRVADDFVIPAGGRTVNYIHFYGYTNGLTTPTITAATVQIWNGAPNAGGTVIFGDTTTNRLANNTMSNIYRTFNTVAAPTCGGATTPAATGRRLQDIYVTVNQFLPAGTYWVDYDFTGASFSPPSTQADAIGRQCDPNDSNGLQNQIGVWATLADTGQGCVVTSVDQGAYFRVLGTGGAVQCYPNCDSSTIQPCLNVQDFGCFLNKFASNDTYANCDSSTIAPVLNVQDFGCFLNKFATGCSNC